MTTLHESITLGQPRRRLALDGCTISIVQYGAHQFFDWHAHRRSNISFVLAGCVAETADHAERARRFAPGCAVFKPAGLLHRNRFPISGARLLVLELDDDLARSMHIAAAQHANYRWTSTGCIIAAGLAVLEALQRSQRCLVHDALTRLFSTCAAPASADESRARRPAPPWLRRLQRELDLACGPAPRVCELARQLDMHPVALNRAFRRHVGCCISAYRRQRQVRAAAGRLANSDEPIVRIAFDTGFADQSHLTRAFRQTYGLPPGRYRRLIRNG